MVTSTGIEPLTPTRIEPLTHPALPHQGEGIKDGEGWKPHRMILLSSRS